MGDVKKVNIHIAAGVAPFQLEGFDKDAERSVKGSLHLCGNTTRCVTEDELEALKKARPDLVATKIRVLDEKHAPKKVVKSAEDDDENTPGTNDDDGGGKTYSYNELKGMVKADLLELAEAKGVELDGDELNADLISAILEVQEDEG